MEESLLSILMMDQDDEFDDFDGIPVPETNAVGVIKAEPIIFRCVICQENQVQTVNFPCMHACFCIECAKPSLQHSKTCPECRANYKNIAILYPSYVKADIPLKEDKDDKDVHKEDEPDTKKRKTYR